MLWGHLRLKYSYETIVFCELSLKMMAEALLDHPYTCHSLTLANKRFHAGVKVSNFGKSVNKGPCRSRDKRLL